MERLRTCLKADERLRTCLKADGEVEDVLEGWWRG